MMLHRYGLDEVVCREIHLEKNAIDMQDWEDMVQRILHLAKTVTIAIVGNYVAVHDASLSVMEALFAGGYAYDAKAETALCDSDETTADMLDATL